MKKIKKPNKKVGVEFWRSRLPKGIERIAAAFRSKSEIKTTETGETFFYLRLKGVPAPLIVCESGLNEDAESIEDTHRLVGSNKDEIWLWNIKSEGIVRWMLIPLYVPRE